MGRIAGYGNSPLVYTDGTGLRIVSQLRDSGWVMTGVPGFIGNTSITKEGCVITAWSKILNSINGNDKITPASFGSTTEPGASLMTSKVVPGENSGYITATGDLDVSRATSSLSGGKFTHIAEIGLKKDLTNILTAADPNDVLQAIKQVDSDAYVTGQADLGGVLGNHTVNVTGVGDNGDLSVSYSSQSDYDNNRRYSVSGGAGFQLNRVDIAIQTSDAGKFNSALKAIQDQHFNDSVQKVEQAAAVSDDNFWKDDEND